MHIYFGTYSQLTTKTHFVTGHNAGIAGQHDATPQGPGERPSGGLVLVWCCPNLSRRPSTSVIPVRSIDHLVLLPT